MLLHQSKKGAAVFVGGTGGVADVAMMTFQRHLQILALELAYDLCFGLRKA